MEPYTGKILEQYLETKSDWLLQKFREEIDFRKSSKDKSVAYYWFEIQPESFDISFGEVSFHNSSAGYYFMHGHEFFPFSPILLKDTDLEIFLHWFSKVFRIAGGNFLSQHYLISHRDEARYYSLQRSCWLAKEEVLEIATRKTSTILIHQATGLQFTFPVHYQNKIRNDQTHDEHPHVYFEYEDAHFEIKIEVSQEESLSRKHFLKQKKAELQEWKRTLIEEGFLYLHESGLPVAPDCPSLRITGKKRSGQLQTLICFFARDKEDEDTVFRILIECTDVETKHESIFTNMVQPIGENSKKKKEKKWWKFL